MVLPHLRRLAIASGIVAVLGGCGGDSPGGPMVIGDPVPGGTAVVAVTSDFQAFNTVTNSSLVTMEVLNFMLFTPLIQFDEDLEAVPALAESWELDDEGVTFRLRNDVQWHDGQPFTSADCVFNWEYAIDTATALNAGMLGWCCAVAAGVGGWGLRGRAGG